MKKTILIVGLIVAALAVFGVGAAFAQGPSPYGVHGLMMHKGGSFLHPYMVAAFVEKFGLSVEDINTRLAAGETMYDIAISDGVKAEDFPALMADVRTEALVAAVKDGVITQAQADWMKSRGFGRGGNHMGTGTCPMNNGAGSGRGGGMMRGGGWQNQPTNPK